MASLLEMDAEGLNNLAKNHKDIYPIASRCGLFAKIDIQALINQSIFILQDIYKRLPDLKITYFCVTGYGEDLIKAGLKMDLGEVETLAHYKGAKLFQDDVDFILDIGGQDNVYHLVFWAYI